LKEITAGEIMSTVLTTISEDEKISTAEIKMIKKNVGGLPVVKENNVLVGIVTQRDIQLSKFSVLGNAAFHVSDIMSKNPVTATADEKMLSIVKKMTEYDIERIPVVDDNNKVVGIIVMKDIIHALASHLES